MTALLLVAGASPTDRAFETASRRKDLNQSSLLRELSAQQRLALGLFLRSTEVTRNDVAKYFKLAGRQAYLLCQRWLKAGFLKIGNPSTKSRTYRLAAKYDEFVTLRDARSKSLTKQES